MKALQGIAQQLIQIEDFENFIVQNRRVTNSIGGYNLLSFIELATPDQKTGQVKSVEVAKIMHLMGQALIKELLLAAGEEISLENIKKINLMYAKLSLLESFLIPGQKDVLMKINDFYQS